MATERLSNLARVLHILFLQLSRVLRHLTFIYLDINCFKCHIQYKNNIMRIFLTVVFELYVCLLFGQAGLTSFNRSDTTDYFAQGVIAFQHNEIIKADSLFAKSYLIEPSKDALFNQAMTRFVLNDTCSACHNLELASKLFDDDNASQLFYTLCLTRFADNYYDKKYKKIENPDEYTYYEEIKTPKCQSVTYGIIHKRNHKSTVMLNHFLMKSVDNYATYFILDSSKFFDFVYASTFEEDNREKIQEFKGRLKQYINAKYNFDEIPANKRFVTSVLLIDKEGAIVSSKIQTGSLAAFDESFRDTLESDLNSSLMLMPVLKPQKFMGKGVSSAYLLRIGL